MATSWSVCGEYMEACSCDFLCPCITENVTTPATHDFCKVAMTYAIASGHYGETRLDGLRFAVVADTPAIMSQGNWTLGVIIDERASEAQATAIEAIASGKSGGPLAGFGALVSNYRGATRAAIDFQTNGAMRTVTIAGQVEQSVQGIPSPSVPGDCLAIDNTMHPANRRLSLAKAAKSLIRCFGIEWQAPAGRTNGHFAPFAWQGQTV
jgi:hypothetical protein